MKILAVDDEVSALNILTRAILEILPDVEMKTFQKASTAMEEVIEHRFKPDIAFLDIELPGISGLELAATLKIAYPKMNIIFVTGFSQYALEAMEYRPSGYLLKPVTTEKIMIEIRNLRYPPERTVEKKKIRIQCFGSFKVFSNGEPIVFSRAKSKELLAYLVDRRGATCSAAEMAAVLWEDGIYDRSRQKQLSVLKLDLIKALKQVEAEHIVYRSSGGMSLNTEEVDCDYYQSLKGDNVALNSFLGEYMMPYSWAEITTAALVSKFKK